MELDLWFLLDGVASYSQEEFQLSLDLISDMASKFDISTSTVQIGFAGSYENRYHTYFDLNETNTVSTLQTTLSQAHTPRSKNTITLPI